MTSPDASPRSVQQLLDAHPDTFAAQAGITLRDKPSPLFRLLVLTSLLSANLDPRLGLRTARALSRAGFRTAQRLAAASDRERWEVLSESRNLRKEQTASQLGELAEESISRYAGDLRRLRDEAAGDVPTMRGALQQFTGIGPTGADIFLREAQSVWPALRPFADERVLRFAGQHDLPHTPAGLARRAGLDDLSGIGAALVLDDIEERSG